MLVIFIMLAWLIFATIHLVPFLAVLFASIWITHRVREAHRRTRRKVRKVRRYIREF
jgi:hypothetical protein